MRRRGGRRRAPLLQGWEAADTDAETGLLIVFEGGEGSGKSTQARALKRRIEACGSAVILHHEPGGTRLGNAVARWLKWGGRVDPLAELFLFAAARAQIVSEVVRPALSEGKVVILDRFTDSTLAYQGYGRGLDLPTIRNLNEIATQGLKPGLVILLDIEVERAFARKDAEMHDRIEKESAAFHRRVREGYKTLARAEPERWLVIDGSLPKGRIAELIWARVEPMIARNPPAREMT